MPRVYAPHRRRDRDLSRVEGPHRVGRRRRVPKRDLGDLGAEVRVPRASAAAARDELLVARAQRVARAVLRRAARSGAVGGGRRIWRRARRATRGRRAQPGSVTMSRPKTTSSMWLMFCMFSCPRIASSAERSRCLPCRCSRSISRSACSGERRSRSRPKGIAAVSLLHMCGSAFIAFELAPILRRGGASGPRRGQGLGGCVCLRRRPRGRRFFRHAALTRRRSRSLVGTRASRRRASASSERPASPEASRKCNSNVYNYYVSSVSNADSGRVL